MDEVDVATEVKKAGMLRAWWLDGGCRLGRGGHRGGVLGIEDMLGCRGSDPIGLNRLRSALGFCSGYSGDQRVVCSWILAL